MSATEPDVTDSATITPAWVARYQPGVPAEIELPTESLFDLLVRSVAEAGPSTACTFFGRQTTYADLGAQVMRAAEGLRRLGVRQGDRVAIMLPNCPQHVVAFYAALRIGAIVVEHNPLATPSELDALFADHGAKVAIAWDVAVPKLQDFTRAPALEHIVAVNLLEEFPRTLQVALRLPVKKLRETRAGLTAPTTGTVAWKQLLDAPPVDPAVPRPRVEDVAVIQYTSGTTGKPKGAILTHLNLYANALQGAAWMKDAEFRKEVFFAVLPMFHAFGMTLYLTFGVLKQANIVLFPKFDVDMILKAAKKTPPTVYCAVPPIYRKTAETAKERGISLKSAKFCISGAMALTDDIVELWESVSGGLLVEGYGMTESSPVAMGNPFWPTRRTGTIGVPFPSTHMKVTDPEDPTREVAQGEPGELQIRGPQVFQGYWTPARQPLLGRRRRWLEVGEVQCSCEGQRFGRGRRTEPKAILQRRQHGIGIARMDAVQAQVAGDIGPRHSEIARGGEDVRQPAPVQQLQPQVRVGRADGTAVVRREPQKHSLAEQGRDRLRDAEGCRAAWSLRACRAAA